MLSKSGSGFSAGRSDVLKKVKKSCSFRALVSVFLLLQCSVRALSFFKEMWFGGDRKKTKFWKKN